MAGKSGNKLHEKHQLILANMLREEDNRHCADCHAKGPRWASWNLGVFMCIRCAGIHRNLGVHISRVKSVNLDSWTPEQIASIQSGGNAKAKAKYEANLPANFRRPQDDYGVEQFIRSKYERKVYVSKDPPAVTTTTESRSSPAPSPAKEKTNKKKSTEHHEKKKDKFLPVPRPQNVQRSPTPPTRPAPSSSPNLISMATSTENSTASISSVSSGQPVIDLLTDGNASTASSSSPWQSSSQQPLVGEDPQNAVKQNILSLYQNQQQTIPGASGQGYQAYTAQGFPVNPYHYQQQQMAALRMAQQQQMMAAQQQVAQQQVKEVEEKMKQLRMQQGQQPGVANGQPFLQPSQAPQPSLFPPQPPSSGGQTLNPHLW